MSPEERIEAVARKLAMLDAGAEENWEAYSADAKEVVSATLQSLLEPSEAMRDAAYDQMGAEAGADYPSPEASWQAMIDTAIKEMS